MASDIYLGTQGWTNKNWRGNFYPRNAPPENYLAEYAKHFHAVEIDSTFYAIPRPDVVRHWGEMTSHDFRFAAKFPRVITHQKIMTNVASETRQFLDVMALLKEKLGPLVLQFPFDFRPQQRERLAQFLATLPREFRYAVEVRHPDWFTEPFYDLLKEHRVALVLADYGKTPASIQTTTDVAYIRWVGNRKDFPAGPVHALLDRSTELDEWSRAITRLAEQGAAVWGFANDVYQGHAPTTIRALMERVHGSAI
jgi:uncharacterized protein YecE (DUF72 family)